MSHASPLRRFSTFTCALLLCVSSQALLCAAENPAGGAKPTEKPVAIAALLDQPAVKTGKDGKPDAGFLAKHESFLKRGKEGPIGVLFLGDSITAGWAGSKPIWDKYYGMYQPANFGIGGDRTQHVLWRIANGELDGIDPKVVVLMIGTNNSGSSAEDILKGDTAIVNQIHSKLPKAKLLLLGIFPRGMDPKDAGTAKLREKLATVNVGLAKLDDGKQTRYLDIGPKFLAPDGVLAKDIMPDALHPNAKGYQIWAEAMQPLLDELMKQ
jgi:lysophospholipase L1-like esterase